MRYRETKEKLEQAGIDTSRYRPTPSRHPSEVRSRTNFNDDADDIDPLVLAAKETPLERAWREHRAKGTVIHHPPNTVLHRAIGRVTAIR